MNISFIVLPLYALELGPATSCVVVSRRDREWEGSFIITAGPASLGKEGLGTLPKSSQCMLARHGQLPRYVCVLLTWKTL